MIALILANHCHRYRHIMDRYTRRNICHPEMLLYCRGFYTRLRVSQRQLNNNCELQKTRDIDHHGYWEMNHRWDGRPRVWAREEREANDANRMLQTLKCECQVNSSSFPDSGFWTRSWHSIVDSCVVSETYHQANNNNPSAIIICWFDPPERNKELSTN